MKGFIIRDSDGRMMYFGHVKNKKQLHQKPGYSFLPSTTPYPDASLVEPMWSGTAWVAGPADQKKARIDTRAAVLTTKIRNKQELTTLELNELAQLERGIE